MSTEATARACRVFVILNSGSGNSAPDRVRERLSRFFSEHDGPEIEFHDLERDEDPVRIVKAAVSRGCDLVVAAGGDGTVSTVASALVGGRARLGILPLGTTNVLAHELNIPLDLDGACRLLAGPNGTVEIDAMRVGEAYYFTQIGVGVDAEMIRDTADSHKKRYGALAYVWTALVRLAGFQPRHFSIAADDARERTKACEVLIANCGTVGSSRLRWTPDSRADDGRVEVCAVRARTVLDYLKLTWDLLRSGRGARRHVRYLSAERTVAIHSDEPLPIQADGELIGTTPLEVRVVPRVLRVAAPTTTDIDP